MDISEALESPGFWLLAVGGNAAVVMGWIMSKKSGWEALPIWQTLVIMAVITIASAFFATKD